MHWRIYLLLTLLSLLAVTGVSFLQSSAGYMDADYYLATGLRLASGRGFSEPFLWNFLDDPQGLPHPSHAYWMPLASLLAGVVPAMTGCMTWMAARLPFILIAVSLPALTAALAYALTSRRTPALLAGLLAVFSGFYFPFLPVTDTFGICALLGGLFFLVLARNHCSAFGPLLLGGLAGLMQLARADGLLWLVPALIGSTLCINEKSEQRSRLRRRILKALLCVVGYLLVMLPWFIRNVVVFGTPLAPGGSRALWITGYDQIFSYPASSLSFQSWLAAGIGAALKVRLWALILNLETALAVQGGIFLLPLIVVGFWKLRAHNSVKLALLTWLLIFLSMTLVFPLAGARGGFFHSGAAIQPMFWVMTPIGLAVAVEWVGIKRGWKIRRALHVFSIALLGLAVLLTAFIAWDRVIGESVGQPTWGRQARAYSHVEELIVSVAKEEGSLVMVANPPGYYLATGRSAVVIPFGEMHTALEAAVHFGCNYLVLEPEHLTAGMNALYKDPLGWDNFIYLGEVEEMRVYAIQP